MTESIILVFRANRRNPYYTKLYKLLRQNETPRVERL